MAFVLTQQQILEQLIVIGSILGKQKKISGVNQCVSDFFTLFNQFHEASPQDSYDINIKLNEVRGVADNEIEYLQLYSEDLLGMLKKIKERLARNPAPPINYLKATKKKYASSYKRDRERYVSFITQINDTEDKIMTSPFYEKRYHELLGANKYKGFIHARINQNFRIMYQVDGDTVVFYNIVTHDEMERN